jgi:hypothetical protein
MPERQDMMIRIQVFPQIASEPDDAAPRAARAVLA